MKRDIKQYARDGTDGQAVHTVITSHKQARAYAETCFRDLRLDMSAKLLLHLMACKWHPKYGWQRGQNSIARLMAVSNSTATHALQQLLALGVIYEAEPGKGRRAPRYDFGPNRVDVVEPLHPVEPDTTQPDLDPAEVDATDAPSNSVSRMNNPPLYPAQPDAFGIRVADSSDLSITGDADEWDGYDLVPPGEF